MEIPVIIAHFGTAPSYLGYCLGSAAAFNNKVVLVGDKANQYLWDEHYDCTSLKSKKYQEFINCLVKLSDYSRDYEISFWKRMFLLEEWMKQHEAQSVFLLDSDIVSFANYTKDVHPLLSKDCIAALSIPQKQDNFIWTASTHFSYWTLEGIGDFTNFCIDTYTDKNNLRELLEAKYQWHLENNFPGGVSEMTLLYLWSKDNTRIFNLAKTLENKTSDHSINTSANFYENEYEVKFGLKHLTFRNGVPYGYNKLLNQSVRFFCLHCQGDAKLAMGCLASKRWKRLYFVGKLVGRTKAFLGAKKAALKK